MPEIFMSEVTDLPFYHVILASEDIFGRSFFGSQTLRVAKSMWQRPYCYTNLGVQTNLAIIIYFHSIDFDLLDYVQRTVGRKGPSNKYISNLTKERGPPMRRAGC